MPHNFQLPSAPTPQNPIASHLHAKFTRLHASLVSSPTDSPSKNLKSLRAQTFKESMSLLNELYEEVLNLANQSETPVIENLEKTSIATHLFISGDESILALHESHLEEYLPISIVPLAFKTYVQHRKKYLLRDGATHLSVATFNVKQFGKEKADAWTKDKLVRHFLIDNVFLFDIIALQEVESVSAVQDLINKLNLSDRYEVHGSAQCHEAILVKNVDRFDMVEVVEGLSQFGSVNETCGFCTVRITMKGKKDCFYVNSAHLSPSNVIQEYEFLLTRIEEYSPQWKEENWILLGDYNVDYETERMQKLFDEDGLVSCSDPGIPTTPSSKVYDVMRMTKPLVSEREVIRGVISLPEESPRKLFKPPNQGPVISDHFPVYCVLEPFFPEKKRTKKAIRSSTSQKQAQEDGDNPKDADYVPETEDDEVQGSDPDDDPNDTDYVPE